MAAKKESTPLNTNNLPGGSSQIDFNEAETNVLVDQELVNSAEKELGDKRKENREKLYAISMKESLLRRYENFMTEEVEWNSTEALGVKEVSKQIQKIKKEGVKNQVIYMSALPLEASHYFISKGRGKGLKSAETFIELYKPFDQALSDAKKDVSEIKGLEKQLGAAMQGVSLG